jgi:hypothetical protein
VKRSKRFRHALWAAIWRGTPLPPPPPPMAPIFAPRPTRPAAKIDWNDSRNHPECHFAHWRDVPEGHSDDPDDCHHCALRDEVRQCFALLGGSMWDEQCEALFRAMIRRHARQKEHDAFRAHTKRVDRRIRGRDPQMREIQRERDRAYRMTARGKEVMRDKRLRRRGTQVAIDAAARKRAGEATRRRSDLVTAECSMCGETFTMQRRSHAARVVHKCPMCLRAGTSRAVTIDGISLPASVWCRKLGVPPARVRYLVNRRGLAPEEAMAKAAQEK